MTDSIRPRADRYTQKTPHWTGPLDVYTLLQMSNRLQTIRDRLDQFHSVRLSIGSDSSFASV
ncbi:MAG: hypothetical protein ACREQ1_03060, partial [Woeseiaceae bacterium]